MRLMPEAKEVADDYSKTFTVIFVCLFPDAQELWQSLIDQEKVGS